MRKAENRSFPIEKAFFRKKVCQIEKKKYREQKILLEMGLESGRL